MKKYWIWSIEHTAWWAPDERGYTLDKNGAGVYDEKRAIEICQRANIGTENKPNEAMVPIPVAK